LVWSGEGRLREQPVERRRKTKAFCTNIYLKEEGEEEAGERRERG